MSTQDDKSDNFSWLEEPEPSKGEHLLLLTSGKIPVIGKWSKTGGFIAWATLPPKNSYKDSLTHPPPSGNLLILNQGNIPIISSWKNGYGFKKWHLLPMKTTT